MGLFSELFGMFKKEPARASLPVENHYEVLVLFGARLRIARSRNNLTQREVAELVGATGNDVSAWEYAKKSPTPKQREKLDELFGNELSA